MIADGQVHGGIAQGIGNALLEEIVYDETAASSPPTLADYMPPTAHEIPPIELHHMETPSRKSITKAKGLGEGGAIGAPAAVINAINDALIAVRRRDRRNAGDAAAHPRGVARGLIPVAELIYCNL